MRNQSILTRWASFAAAAAPPGAAGRDANDPGVRIPE